MARGGFSMQYSVALPIILIFLSRLQGEGGELSLLSQKLNEDISFFIFFLVHMKYFLLLWEHCENKSAVFRQMQYRMISLSEFNNCLPCTGEYLSWCKTSEVDCNTEKNRAILRSIRNLVMFTFSGMLCKVLNKNNTF